MATEINNNFHCDVYLFFFKTTQTFSFLFAFELFVSFLNYEINYKAFWLQEETCEVVSKKLQRQHQTQQNHRILAECWLEEILGAHTVQLPTHSRAN